MQGACCQHAHERGQTDAGPGIKACINYALDKLNFEKLGMNSDWVVGPSLWGTFKTLGIPEENLNEAVNLYRERYNVKGYLENSVYLGIPGQLAILLEMGYVLSLATSKPTVSARAIIEYFNLKQYFLSCTNNSTCKIWAIIIF